MNSSLNYLIELDEIFETKGWKTKENYLEVFNSFGRLTEFLSEDEENYKLLIELLNRFHWISLNDYYNSCRKLLIEFSKNLGHRIFNIYTFPIIKKRHEGTVKSGLFITYMIKAIIPTIPKLEKLKFEDIITYDDLKNKRFTKSDEILLVDDFIGTGNTFDSCINEIQTINKDILSKVSVFTVAIKKDTLEQIRKKFTIYSNYEVLKGITDYSTGADIVSKKEIMKNIEQKLFLNIKNYSLGYNESESLITLLRTPDTTFPLFWHEYKGRIKLKPPFPRHEKN
ncbi:phosphoribosyltransferase-like protein [Tenacibaculum aquimarinum]|uniref:phosphoribosyltransferase-like protein n=1 Tax=Tenacibaculum aquimarinum TaxID=2910675 RepID=UPI001F0A4CC3|nr:hypothetical protein [Tenacibaculum aquimarinum]MCH3885448.1 hypothetical protein [Tenacibaculum aquimarinum]